MQQPHPDRSRPDQVDDPLNDHPMPRNVTVIEAGASNSNFFREATEYRELLTLLAWRDVSVRYRQTVLGVGWAIFRPALTTFIFVVVFALIVRVPSPETPYPLLVLAGLLVWQLVAGSILSASESLLGNAAMLSKVYFPRVLLPFSACASPLADFAVGVVLLSVVIAWYGVTPTWRIMTLPGLLLIALCLAIGIGLWLSAAAVRYRDLRQVAPFAVQVGVYVSPVGYPTSLVPERWQLVYALNPAVGLIDGFRWALLGHPQLNVPALGISLVAAMITLIGGLAYFRRVERGLVDIL